MNSRLFIFDDVLNLTKNKAYAILIDSNIKNKHMLPISQNNIFALLVTMTAAVGVFVHDSRMEKAIDVCMVKDQLTINNMIDLDELNFLKSQHVHSEGVSLLNSISYGSAQPSSQPRKEGEGKYIAQKRLVGNSFGSELYLPFI